ncbi:Protein phosphatase 2C-like, partial [hydrothermal vent metagenome]
GSTVVTLGIKENVGVCLWAGDSRLYRLRNEELIQLSRDHSQVEELVQQGFITAEAAQSHPDSNIITRAIGANAELFIDINVFSSQMGDTFLLCSDGLYNMVKTEEIRQILLQLPINEAVLALIQKALERGANDNVSVILVNGELDAVAAPQLDFDVNSE